MGVRYPRRRAARRDHPPGQRRHATHLPSGGGFVKDAHYRRGWPTGDGRLLDAVGYALLRTDWRDGTATPVDFNDEHDPIDGPRRGVAQGRAALVSASARKLGGKTGAVAIQIEHELGEDELVTLYASVGWKAYTRSPDALSKAIGNSSIVVTARDERGELIGLARGLSDDASIFYLQDVLVRHDHQRTGIGRQLLRVCLERYGHVRQKVLLTDDDEAQQRFYESLGYIKTTNVTAASLDAYVRSDPSPTP